MVPEAGNSWRRGSVLLVVLVLLGGAGVATAAVAGNFSSSYDGYDDGSETNVRGHEIQVSGTLEFSGQNAVKPRIIIESSQHTVLDDGSVTLLQPGSSSIDFRRDVFSGGVRYRAEEIPSGTKLKLEFVVYPVSGLTQPEIQSAQVVVVYDLPSGQSERKTIDVTTSLNNTPPQVIGSQQSSGTTSLAIKIFAVIGGISVVAGLLFVVYKAFIEESPPPGPAP